MEGWRPVDDLIRWGFAHAPVVMANEALHWPGEGTQASVGETLAGVDAFVVCTDNALTEDGA